jgi:crotonobetainyl-CoA:carnitine CoA-transferase CaiB-like acyl-CoA transferase
MTGLPGKPMRAGASVNDIMGAMFGVIGILAALRERETTGKGREVQASLFENNAFLMSQSMLAEAITGVESQPWSVQERPWTVYDLFDTKDGTQLFFGIVGDTQWIDFCNAFDKPDWLADPRLQNNGDRTAARSWLMPEIRALIGSRTADELSATFERIGLPFAPVRRPAELADDVHLNASGGLVEVTLPDGRRAKTPLLPLAFGGRRIGFPVDPPAVGADTLDILAELGFAAGEIERMTEGGKVSARAVAAVR